MAAASANINRIGVKPKGVVFPNVAGGSALLLV